MLFSCRNRAPARNLQKEGLCDGKGWQHPAPAYPYANSNTAEIQCGTDNGLPEGEKLTDDI